MIKLLAVLLSLFPVLVHAEEEASFEENIKVMDSNHDGQVTISEVRAFLEAEHGKGYKQALLEEMETKAGTKSCGSPFSKSLY